MMRAFLRRLIFELRYLLVVRDGSLVWLGLNCVSTDGVSLCPGDPQFARAECNGGKLGPYVLVG